MNVLRKEIEGESWANFSTFLLGTWLILALYIQIHDQIIVSIDARHFTEYHTNPFHIENPKLLAAGWGIAASAAPSLFLGLAAYILCRLGKGSKVSPKQWLRKLVRVILLAALICWGGGILAYKTGFTPFPMLCYPVEEGSLFFTQTVQLYAYSGGALIAGVQLLILSIRRRKNRLVVN